MWHLFDCERQFCLVQPSHCALIKIAILIYNYCLALMFVMVIVMNNVSIEPTDL